MSEQKQASARECFVCGVANPVGLHLKFVETHPGEVTAEVTLPEHFQGYPGIAHGGIIAAMLDETGGRTHMGSADAVRFSFTIHLDVRYRKNVPVGQPLRLVGKAKERKGRTAKAVSAIYDVDGTLLAEADVVLVDVPARMVQDVDLDALGWRVYSDEELSQAAGKSVDCL